MAYMAEETNLPLRVQFSERQKNNLQVQTKQEETLVITNEERSQIEELKQQIDFSDSVTSVEYGIGNQRRLAEFSDKILENAGQSGENTAVLLQALIDEIKALNPGAAFKDNFWSRIPFFGSRARRMRKLKKRFSKARVRIENIQQRLERIRIELLRNAEMFDILAQENSDCFRQLSLYIQAGKEKLNYVRNVELPKIAEEVKAKNDPMEAQMLYGLEENLSHFENRIHDLELSQTIALQSAPQMKLIQTGNSVMAQKIQSAVLNTIPIWKNQFAAAVGLADQTAVYKTQQKLDKVTNKMIAQNAEILRQSAVQTAVESHRSGIDTESLQKANDSLIRVIEETLQLNRESTAQHQRAEAELGRIEHQLKNALEQSKF